MVSCLILFHKTITSLTKITILRAVFQEEDFEIHVIDKDTVMMYLWNVDKASILQVALVLETEDINTGFGFGACKLEALNEAKGVLDPSPALSTSSLANTK
ncbi:hypothetical protein SAMN04488072_108180 [Lentibacillus halodurans]|uniref:Uncharacterized protein n=1 Tax=Lentibacillus halodurans TaxID=237679 RepID=A0A1I0YUW2_9BACI|nr:hypothetical protein [Lentibacillus halodurans]SFB16777.1 hypothetical protein SAMN04488072_108180 [Lentibacillus halodurans]